MTGKKKRVKDAKNTFFLIYLILLTVGILVSFKKCYTCDLRKKNFII